MSGARLVGALGQDQTKISTGTPTHRKGNGRRGGGRDRPVPGAGVGAGGNRVRFQEIPEDTCGAGGGVGTQVVDLIQEHIRPPPQVTSPWLPV